MPTRAAAQTLLELAARLPAAARILSSLQLLLHDANTSLEDVCALLKLDMALTARTISISNSSYYGSGLAHSSLEEAISYVGFNDVYKLVAVTVGAQMCQDDLRYYACRATRLWENTMGNALAMESLAQFAGTNPRTAYTAGLMRSIGKAVLEIYAQKHASSIRPYDPATGATLEQWELANFGVDSAAVGGSVLRDWHFPEEICLAVEDQLKRTSTQGTLLYVANRLVRELDLGLPGETKPTPCELVEIDTSSADVGDTELRLVFLETKSGFERLQQALQPTAMSAASVTAALAAK
ncbi:MAG TPA: HDOD domain-containing protein [Opitutaceae bacterium]|jgi:HD-like signal output (HDOD) protein